VTGSKRLTRLLAACETRGELERAVEVLRLSRGLMNHRQVRKPFSGVLTETLIDASKRAAAPDVLIDLMKERHLLGLAWSNTKLARALEHINGSGDAAAQIYADASRARDLYDAVVVQVREEKDFPSKALVRLLMKGLVYNGQQELAVELAEDVGDAGGCDAPAVVAHYEKQFQAENPPAGEEADGGAGAGEDEEQGAGGDK